MKIAVLDDYQDVFRKLACCERLRDHEVVVFHDTEKGPAKLAARLKDFDAVILSQQRFARQDARHLRFGKNRRMRGAGRQGIRHDSNVLGTGSVAGQGARIGLRGADKP